MALMKVVHVVEATFAGVGRHVQDLATWQVNNGYEVTVFYSSTRISTGFKEKIESLPGINWVEFESTNKPRLADLKVALRVRNYCKGKNISFIHGHSSIGGLIARLAGIGLSAKVLYTPNAFFSMNPTLSKPAEILYSKVELVLSGLTNCLICVSPEELQHAEKLGLNPKKSALVPNGIDPPQKHNKNEIIAEYGLNTDHPVVGFVGRFDNQKSPIHLVEICAQIIKKSPDVQFVLAGEGPLLDEAKSVAAKLGVADKLLFPGLVVGVRMIQAFDVFLLPSRYEGFPYVLIESVMLGVPFVTTDAAGASSLLQEDAGYILPVGDINGMSESVLELVNNETLRKTKSNNAISISKNLTLVGMCEDVDKVYKSLLKHRFPKL